MRDWAQPVWECPASSEGRTSAELVPLHPGPPTWAREPPAPSPQAHSPEFTRNQRSAASRPDRLPAPRLPLLAWASAAPHAHKARSCHWGFIRQDLLELSITQHEAQPPAPQTSASCGLLGWGWGESGFGACSLRSRFLDNPSPLLSSSRNPCHWEEAPGPESSP